MNLVSQWLIGGLRTRKAKVMTSILMGGSVKRESAVKAIKLLSQD